MPATPVDLSDVQGNILKGFNKPNVRLVFFKFGKDADKTIEWLANTAKRIKSTEDLKLLSKELHEKRDRDPNYKPQETFLHVSLSKKGIDHLKTKDSLYLPLPPSKDLYSGQGKKSELQEQYKRDAIAGVEDPFEYGMTRQHDTLGDIKESHPSKWEDPYRGNKIDALFIVASDEEDDLRSYVEGMIKEAENYGVRHVVTETGKALLNEQGKQVEHFGFRDGVSQPLIDGIDDEEIAKRKDYPDVFSPEDFVLFGLTGELSWANNGSFLVYRKLEQNVAGFWNFMRKKYEEDNRNPKPEELAALLVGRWKSGAPLAKHRYEPTSPKFSDDNDFKYMEDGEKSSKDEEGKNTPTFAHTRWVNPRDSERIRTHQKYDDNLKEGNQHRILRRGIPYGALWATDRLTKEAMENDEIEEKEQGRRGLLFLCYQRDIFHQFEYLQIQLSNPQNWRSIAGPHKAIIDLQADSGYKKLGIEHYITTKGGEYFFSPSISALADLKKHMVEENVVRPKPSKSTMPPPSEG